MSLLLLFRFMAVMMSLVQASKPVTMPTKTGATHAFIIWRDPLGNIIGKAQLSQSDYELLSAAGDHPPKIPVEFTGTAKSWTDGWHSGLVTAGGGRPTVNTPSGEFGEGGIEVLPDNTILLYMGDVDMISPIVIKQNEYMGVPPSITVMKCGVVVVSGQLAGTKDQACK